MKLPDITLLFQIFHFVIAYWILRRYIFSPALIILNQQQDEEFRMKVKLDQARHRYETLLTQKSQKWNFIQQSLLRMIPKFLEQSAPLSGVKPSETNNEMQPLNQQERQRIKDRLRDEVIEIK
jgi:hypothetical protein